MSAITGIFNRTGQPVDCDDLQKMTDILAHRGPDGQGIWRDVGIGLGHRMLWTTPESLQEHLPFVNEAPGLAITADARIDNRDELLPLLGLTNRPAGTISDSEVILAAYGQWGEQCPEHLLGDFAFAVWDSQARKLFCARDHFGVKPFYYHMSETSFAFASEIKALFCLPHIARTPSEVTIAEYLSVTHHTMKSTFFEGIQRLSAAHCMTIDAQSFMDDAKNSSDTEKKSDNIMVRPYWNLDLARNLQLESNEEYARQFRIIFTEAVRCRMRSAFPVGSMLSGGLDSSAISCVARDLLVQDGLGPLPTFSAIFDAVPETDEREYMESVISQGNITPAYLHADEFSPLVDLEEIQWHQDEVTPINNNYINWCICKMSRDRGIRVLMNGFDGDTTVSHGFGYLRELALQGRWLHLTRNVRPLAAQWGEKWERVLWRWFRDHAPRQAAARWPAVRRVQVLWRKLRPAVERPAPPLMVRDDVAARTGLSERMQAAEDVPQTERAAHCQALENLISSDTLELLDRTAAANSLEFRYPFCDKRLAEFCLSLPAEQKIARGWTRLIMRRALEGILPDQVCWRKGKATMIPGFNYILRRFAMGRMQEMLAEKFGPLEAYVDFARLRPLYAQYQQDPTKTVDQSLLNAFSTFLWLQSMALRPKASLQKGGEHIGKENLHDS